MAEYVVILGRPSCWSSGRRDHRVKPSQALRTLFIQEMLRGECRAVPVISAAHTDEDLDVTVEAAAGALEVYAQAINGGSTDGLLEGRPVAPAMREFAQPRRL